MANKAKVKKVPYAKLKGLRAERDMSMEDMARLLGVSESTYLARENGKRDWLSSEMFKLSSFFKLTMDEIFLP